MNKQQSLSRRGFLKLAGLSLMALAFRPPFGRVDPRKPQRTGRITIDEIDLRARPDDTSPILGKRYRDQLITIYEEIESPAGPAWNPRWYRIWGGYIHSAYVQLVNHSLHIPHDQIVETGMLSEVTVPFTQAFTYRPRQGWREVYRLYYETTHSVTGLIEGPDRQPWYRITSELDSTLDYFAPAQHLRLISDAEIAPLSPHVPAQDKSVRVDIATQTLTAYEGNTQVFSTRISSGLPSAEGIPAGTRTTRGQFNIASKSPSKHMGSLLTAGAPGDYVLPGVPWTSFFIFEYGVAFHGTFWHNNFGVPMSHGCINMRNADAKWLFRWITPVWEIPANDPSAWDRRGFGTRVDVV